MITKRVARTPSLRDFVANRDGAVSIEHAVLFGVVTISLIVGVYSLGQMSKAALSSASSAIGSATGEGSIPADQAEHLAQANAAQTQPQAAGWHVIAVGIALFVACGAPVTYILLRPYKKSKSKQAEEPAPKKEPTHEDNAFEKRQQIRRVFENNMASLLKGHLKVRHVMSRQLTCVRKTATVESILELMELKKVRHIMVSEADGTLLGTITDKDCAKRSGKRAADVMTTDPTTLDADSDFAPAVTMLIRRRVSCLPVTSDGKLAGILTTTDFLMALQCALHTLTNVVEHVANNPADPGASTTPRDTSAGPIKIPSTSPAISATMSP